MSTEIEVTEEIKNFAVNDRPIRFRVGDEIFEAAPDVAAELMMRFADQASILERDDATYEQQADVIRRLFFMVLLPESAERFVVRLNDPERPIGLSTFIDVTRWLLEQYGLRPTESDSDSSTGSDNPESGTRSRASA